MLMQIINKSGGKIIGLITAAFCSLYMSSTLIELKDLIHCHLAWSLLLLTPPLPPSVY